MALSSGVKGFRSAVSREKGRPGRKHKVFMQQARKNFDVSDFIDDEYTPCSHVEGLEPKRLRQRPVDAKITAE